MEIRAADLTIEERWKALAISTGIEMNPPHIVEEMRRVFYSGFQEGLEVGPQLAKIASGREEFTAVSQRLFGELERFWAEVEVDVAASSRAKRGPVQ